ncbi:MAG TPA: Rieske (2Fe-2S) protein [Methylophaga aminisulfidivorans]|jgi:nitrite reductase/ring-hydroxylating ferredoxin subunit|uniref:Rieske (2Fe-2S) protein n=1 Tax=Methylophaga TaxID=40222 RepID=UPI0017589DF1|nr:MULTISPECIES: Rieske (2Fe-2S) protein [Methylophaga]HIC45354.1 Rieske (2Fe-2S) protein [Methylophaga sp.]HIM39197.1 Rieske (2Fe-2S) protein [Methylophaga aminisulfidivorans]
MTEIYLCNQNELEEYQTRGFDIELGSDKTLDFFLLKQDGEVRAYLNFCPHLGIPLNWQPDQFMSLEGTHIQCSTHGALFQLEDGYCFSGPCRGESLTPLNIKVSATGDVYLISSS